MKLATYQAEGGPRVGVVHDSDTRLFDLQAASQRAGGRPERFASMLALIDGGDAALDEARALFDRLGSDEGLSAALADVELLAPLRPRQMRDCMSYEKHITQSKRGGEKLMARMAGDTAKLAELEGKPLAPLEDIYRQMPIYYITSSLIVQGPDAVVKWPRYSKVMDYEMEFGVVIGRTGADIGEARARDHIFGYTIFNDFSARDQQMLEMQGWLGPSKGKCFDGGNVLGPWIVTRDEIGDPYSLDACVRVNGDVRGAGTTRDMIFDFEQIIAHMSRDETIHAGEFIGSGTIGNGCAIETGTYLEDGDVVELDFEKIGVLRNKVVRQAAS